MRNIPIAQIEESKVALRDVDKDSEQFKDLVQSIAERGVLNPINVRPHPTEEGKFILIDGLQRFTASGEAGLTEIPAQILEIDEADVLETQIEANLQKVETKPIQYTKQLQRIMSRHPERTLEEQATRLHKSVGWLNDRLSLTKLTPEIQKMVEEGDIKLSNAYAMTRLPEEEQPDWVEKAMTTPPDQFVPQALQRVKDIRAEKRGQKVAATGPAPRLRKLGDIKAEFSRTEKLAANATGDDKKYLDGYLACFQWCLQVDATSQAAWEEEQAKKAAEKEAKKKEREEKKAAEKASELFG